MESKTSFPTVVGVAIVLLAASSFHSCDKKADSLVQPENGRESLSNPSIMPQVVSTVPPNYATGPFKIYAPGPTSGEPHFIVQFNKYMNVASVKELTVTCDGFSYPVRVRAKNYYYYYYYALGRGSAPPRNPGSRQGTAGPFDELIEFEILRYPYNYPTPAYELGKTYTVTIDTTIQDINGNRLSNPYSFSFTPEPSFRVTGSYPEDGSKDINMNYNGASLYFNSPVSNAFLSSIHVTPTVPGTWTLNTYDSLSASFNPSNQGTRWGFGKAYSITVDAGAADSRGHALPNEFRSTFSTAPFRVIYTDPPEGSTMIYLTNGVSISFNAELDTSTIRSAITITPAPVGGTVHSFYYNSSSVYLYPGIGFNGKKAYTVTIAPTLKEKNGTAFPNQYVLHFATRPFSVQYTSPSNGDTSFYRYSNIYVETNAYIDFSSLSSSISISPPASLQWSTGGTSCSSSGVLAPSTTYTVTVLPSFRSTAGDTLAAPYSFTFKTGPW